MSSVKFYHFEIPGLFRGMLVAVTWCFAPTLSLAQTTSSQPIGIYAVKIAGKPPEALTARTYVGLQLLPARKFVGIAAGANGNILTLGGSPITFGDAERKSYVHVLAGDGKGFIADIEEFRPSDIRCAVDLTGWISPGTQVMIRPHPHLSDIFGADNRFGLAAGPDADHADNVVIWDTGTQQGRVYFFNSERARWEEKGVTADANRAMVRFPYGIYIVRRSAGSLRIALSGEIGADSVLLPVRDGANVFSMPINLSASVQTLIASTGQFPVGKGPNARRADLLTFQEPSTGVQRGPFYFRSRPSGSGWREVGLDGSDQPLRPLDLLSTLILRRNGAAGYVLAEGSLTPPSSGSIVPIPPEAEPGELPITVEMQPIRGMSPDVTYTLETSLDLQFWSPVFYPLRPDKRVIFTLPPGQSRAFYRLTVTLEF